MGVGALDGVTAKILEEHEQRRCHPRQPYRRSELFRKRATVSDRVRRG